MHIASAIAVSAALIGFVYLISYLHTRKHAEQLRSNRQLEELERQQLLAIRPQLQQLVSRIGDLLEN
ncbi:MAG: hypothetical protein ACE14M_16160 [Terriglobales bacterium]